MSKFWSLLINKRIFKRVEFTNKRKRVCLNVKVTQLISVNLKYNRLQKKLTEVTGHTKKF